MGNVRRRPRPDLLLDAVAVGVDQAREEERTGAVVTPAGRRP